MTEGRKKKSKKGSLVFRGVMMLAVSLILGLNFYAWNAGSVLRNSMPMPFGFGVSVVLTGSMEPELLPDDLVFVREQENYKAGDIVVYQKDNQLIVHRILEINSSEAVTK